MVNIDVRAVGDQTIRTPADKFVWGKIDPEVTSQDDPKIAADET